VTRVSDGTQWDLDRLRSYTRSNPWFRTAYADEHWKQLPFHATGCDGFALFDYTPWTIARFDEERKYVSSLVLDFKKGIPAAIAAVCALAIEAVQYQIADTEADFLYFSRDTLVVPASGVGIGKTATNQLVSTLSAAPLEPANPFTPSAFHLKRHTALSSPSHKEKKSIQDHLTTICLQPTGSGNVGTYEPGRFILFDDVYTRGETFGACKAKLNEVDTAAEVIGFFVAKTDVGT